MNLSRPPFKIIPGQCSVSAADDIVKVFLEINTFSKKVSHSLDVLLKSFSSDNKFPLIAVAKAISRDIDAGVGNGASNAYHNSQHFCEVMFCANYLSLKVGLDESTRLEVVLAALLHDFHHNGGRNGTIPFRLERISVDKAIPYLMRENIPKKQQRRITALILATDISVGLLTARACYAHHKTESVLPSLPILAPELGELFTDATMSRQALILCEADVLPSVGLTLDYAQLQQAKLSSEWGIPLSSSDKLHFIANQFRGFVVCNFFQPNVERFYDLLIEHLENTDG